MNVKDEIKALKERIVELEELAKDEQEFPKYYDDYWYIDTTCDVLSENWQGYGFEEAMLEIGNIFRTEKEAQFAAEKLKVEAELRKFSRPFEYGEDNLTLNYHHKSKALINVTEHSFYQDIGEFYFDNHDKAYEARQAVGEERIKKYIFGVED